MKVCVQCQYENSSQSNFCSKCGARLSDTDVQSFSNSKEKKTNRLAERRQLTILFCDMVGSTPLSEQLDPEEYRQVITDYHEVAEKVLMQYNGHIAQYLGDGLLVYFGYPEGLEDAPKLGVQAGLGILKAVADANKGWEAEGKTSIKIRIGIHTGLVVVDDHLALGETVNIAARLEGLAPHNGLVITPQTMDLVQGWFNVKSIGKRALKGISEPMEIFQVLSESGAKTRLDAAKSRGLSPLVGRTVELCILEKCWEQAKSGKGNLLLINGEAGIGKSRLVDTMEELIVLDRTSWFAAARCSAYQRNSAFYPVIEMFEKYLFQFETADSPEDKLLKLEGLLLETKLDYKSEMALLAEFLSITTEQFPQLIMSPFAKRQKTMDSLTRLLSFKANIQPVFFVLEDLHWADASTKEWLNQFIKELPTHNIFTLCTTRTNFRPNWKESLDFKQIDLKRLSVEDIEEICHHQTNGKTLPEEILKQITFKTEGVPLFVEELTKMILESDLLVEKTDGYELMGSMSSMAIPSTLQDALLARLDGLSEVKEIVQVGAVLGRQFSLEILNAVLPHMGFNMERAMSQLIQAEIFYQLTPGEISVYQFKHALIQDAAYESLLKSRRQQLHLRVANVMERQFIETVQTQPELLAHHFTEAGRPLRAIPVWLKAGQQASQKNATSEAIAHLEKGIDLLPHIKKEEDRNNLELDFQLTLGGTFVVSHGFPHPKVKETFNRARDIAQTIEVSPKLALILFNLLSYYFNTEDYGSAEELSVYIRKLAESQEHGYWFELTVNQLSGGAILKGEFVKAERGFRRVLELFDPSLPFPWELAPSGYIEIGAKSWQMVCLYIMGNLDQAKNLFDHHLSYAKDHKDSMTLYHIYTFPALYCLEAREWKLSERIIEEYLPIVRDFGDPIFTLTAEVYYNIAKAFQGDRSAFDKAVELISVCFDVGFKAFAVSMSPYIGEQYLRIGEYESALKWIEKILDHVNTTGSHIQTAELFRIKGLTLQALGKPNNNIEENFRKALELSREQSARIFELRAAGDLAKLWKNQGKTDESYELMKGVYEWFTEGFDSQDLKEARKILETLKN
ncbi:AAA family ATPase [Eudoraea sp.]|uniref:AAA family ATPase n=1 Tax=Eudoraea sp. TaxID=1979955 RepID=UPI003C754853